MIGYDMFVCTSCFLFKQRTADEMRISDWSSDVCSSDLPAFRLEQAESRLAYSRRPETDLEVCSSLQSIEGFARGQGIWEKLPVASRKLQLESMIALVDELYPTLRWFLYDGLEHYSAPITIFGPTRAAAYIGKIGRAHV